LSSDKSDERSEQDLEATEDELSERQLSDAAQSHVLAMADRECTVR